MSNFSITLIASFALLTLSLLGLAAFWFFGGKKIERGSCGLKPDEKKNCDKKSSCSLCGNGKKKS